MAPGSADNSGGATSPATQPRGWAIACDDQGARVLGHSANLPDLFGPGRASGLIGLHLRDLVGADAAHSLRNALSRAIGAPRPALLPRQTIADLPGTYDCAVHAAGAHTLIEIEPAAEADPLALDRVRALIDRLAQPKGLDKMLHATARLVNAVLQWDCVTVLRLSPEGDLGVVAQQKRLDWPDAATSAELFSFRAPADLALYEATRLRFLADATATPLAWVGAPAPDLSLAHLRAATADESARAARFGFSALLALAIRVEGDLWGLVVAHDRAARRLTMDERAVFDLFADFLSLSAQAARDHLAADEFRRRHAL